MASLALPAGGAGATPGANQNPDFLKAAERARIARREKEAEHMSVALPSSAVAPPSRAAAAPPPHTAAPVRGIFGFGARAPPQPVATPRERGGEQPPQHQASAADWDREAAPGQAVYDDPVWGRFVPPPGKPNFSPLETIGISCCPCCVPPCCAPSRKSAWQRFFRSASAWLAILEILVFIASLCLRGFAPLAENPLIGPPTCVLNTFQAKNAAEIVYRYALWRLVIASFLHAGVIHILFNLLMALRTGIMCEYEWGSAIFLSIYFAGGITAMSFSALINGSAISVGASGALMAVFGAYLMTLALSWGAGDARTQTQRRTQLGCGIFNLAIIVAFSFIPLVDWASHLFGAIAGAALAMAIFGGKLDADSATTNGGHGGGGGSAALSTPLAGGHRYNFVRRLRDSGSAACSCSCARTRGCMVRAAGAVAYLGLTVGGLLALFLASTPPRALLDFTC